MKLVYVVDGYCGWSYGFAPTFAQIVRCHPDMDVEVVCGGLFTGPRRVPIREFGYVQGANARITELTGVRFGAGYERLIADGSFVMDSEAAARGLFALRQAAEGRDVELVTALQEAFYVDGLNLSDPATYRALAEAASLDADSVVRAFTGPAAVAAAKGDFARAVRLGVHSFPTLLAVDGANATILAVGQASVDEIELRLAALAVAP